MSVGASLPALKNLQPGVFWVSQPTQIQYPLLVSDIAMEYQPYVSMKFPLKSSSIHGFCTHMFLCFPHCNLRLMEFFTPEVVACLDAWQAIRNERWRCNGHMLEVVHLVPKRSPVVTIVVSVWSSMTWMMSNDLDDLGIPHDFKDIIHMV